jgi:prepilin-type N-terminal cleavage/methylation domain-containing protein
MASDRPVTGGQPSGFSLVELLMVIAACGILIGVSIRTLLNQARQLAIDQKDFVCVQVSSPTQVSFYPNPTCSGTPWTGPNTDSAGNVNLQPGFTLSVTANPVFDYLGRALPAATFTITNSTTGSTVTVSVSTSGRVSIP